MLREILESKGYLILVQGRSNTAGRESDVAEATPKKALILRTRCVWTWLWGSRPLEVSLSHLFDLMFKCVEKLSVSV